MEPNLTNWLLEHLPATIVAVVVFVAALVFFVWWAAKVWNRLQNAPCKEHGDFIEKHTDKIEGMATSLSKIEGQLSMLIQLMPQITSRAKESLLSEETPTFSQKNSPKVLNANGKKLYDQFDGAEFIAANKEWLLSEVAKFGPKTALDVETYSMAALRIASLDDRFNQLKDKIYHSPAFELELPDSQIRKVEISLEDILFILSIPLRDEYLNHHPEIGS